jgi:putative transposase
MSQDNVGWDAPRIHGELRMLGIDVSESTVAKYMIRHRKPPSQSWRTFLDNHASDLVSVDFFTVPTATFRVLTVFIVLKHDQREVVHFNITQNPTAQWTAQQLVEAFPFDPPPRYLLRDRDAIYAERFRRRVKSLGVEEVITAPRSPWQNPYVERLIGSIRRECLNHVIVLNERHLRRHLQEYFAYYHDARTHLSLAKQCPRHRAVEFPDQGRVIAFPHIGGLHHEYRRAA